MLKFITYCIAVAFAAPVLAQSGQTRSISPDVPAQIQARAIDGDTLELGNTIYRLNGIDAPEYGQTCDGADGKWTCGVDALHKMTELTQNAEVVCDPITNDPYGRIIATCSVNGEDLGRAMIAAGLAWAFVKFSDDYVEDQALAQSQALGIWSGENQPAWDFREMRWNTAKEAAPDGCPIKGNISDNGRIYHAPWSPWYKRTRVSLSKGERWFCDEAEAVAAGWRAPRWP